MGFSWALYFAQAYDETVCASCPALAGAKLVNDASLPMVIEAGRDKKNEGHYYVYVDNVGVFGPHVSWCQTVQTALAKAFDDGGLETHEHGIFDSKGNTLGIDFDLKEFSRGVKGERGWKVREAFLAILRRRRVAGWVIEVMVGHATFCGLSLRGSLCVLNAVYRFIYAHYDIAVPLWNSVVQELVAFAGLIPLLRSFWAIPWNGRVYATDASEQGHVMTRADIGRDVVASVGRVREISRFRLRPGCSARQAVLGADFSSLEDADVDAPLRGVNLDTLETDADFPELPLAMLDQRLWQPCGCGRWKFEDNIVRLEARALLKSVIRLALIRFGKFLCQLIFCDNMSVVLAFNRCRAKDYRLLCVIRQFQAYSLARHLRVSIRRVPSELNSADKPSRAFSGTDGNGPFLPVGKFLEPAPRAGDLLETGAAFNHIHTCNFDNDITTSPHDKSGGSAEHSNPCRLPSDNTGEDIFCDSISDGFETCRSRLSSDSPESDLDMNTNFGSSAQSNP